MLDLENAALYTHHKGGAPGTTAQMPPTRPTYSGPGAGTPKEKDSYTEQSSCTTSKESHRATFQRANFIFLSSRVEMEGTSKVTTRTTLYPA